MPLNIYSPESAVTKSIAVELAAERLATLANAVPTTLDALAPQVFVDTQPSVSAEAARAVVSASNTVIDESLAAPDAVAAARALVDQAAPQSAADLGV